VFTATVVSSGNSGRGRPGRDMPTPRESSLTETEAKQRATGDSGYRKADVERNASDNTPCAGSYAATDDPHHMSLPGKQPEMRGSLYRSCTTMPAPM
jgi:hypothetical protein